MAQSRPRYSGSKRHLILAFDLGTTFSGISYVMQDPGREMRIEAVKRFPGQDKGAATIPSVVYYGEGGVVLAVGAEEPGEDAYSGNHDYPMMLHWFKMLLRPESITVAHDDVPQPKLPPGKDVVDVYADYYKYMFECAKRFIGQKDQASKMFLDSLDEDAITFVLAHPNGWGGAQQTAMRQALVKAELIPDSDDAYERVAFVSEGEASLHFCLGSGNVSDEIEVSALLSDGSTLMIIDAGGGTVDLSTYTFASVSPVEVKEAFLPDCVFEGSVMVRRRAERHIRAKLANSRFGKPEFIEAIANEFDRAPKKCFKGTGDCVVPFSHMMKDTDAKVGIRAGKLKLTEAELLSFFNPGIDAIIRAIEEQRCALAPRVAKTFFLVGGFASNDYLFNKIKDHLAGENLVLLRPDCDSKKAVADGAVSFYIDHFVTARTAKVTYGTRCAVQFFPFLPSHRMRVNQALPCLTGGLVLPGAYSGILTKGSQIAEASEYRKTFVAEGMRPGDGLQITMKIIVHRGSGDPPEFIDEDESSFSTLFEVTADIKDAPIEIAFGPMGPFCMRKVDLVFSFGLTELKVQLAWKDENVSSLLPCSSC
ncbi:hypothetical protein K488DRAFT_52773 [Vararia minispora EC-137]|uniref:Uncharacterized protein n=1 Tax=Vararia minispora EC-137 TaxID=1314806 RepID=A0ACB8QHG2_9AGAM|nr:hypothetical protein K488DRAFT_52773 [Vararia minispora EC-137]